MAHSTERVLRTPINLRPPRVSCREVNTSHMGEARNYLSARHCTAPVTETEPVPDALPREIRAAKRGRDARLMLIRAAVSQVSRAQRRASLAACRSTSVQLINRMNASGTSTTVYSTVQSSRPRHHFKLNGRAASALHLAFGRWCYRSFRVCDQ